MTVKIIRHQLSHIPHEIVLSGKHRVCVCVCVSGFFRCTRVCESVSEGERVMERVRVIAQVSNWSQAIQVLSECE